MGRQLKQAAELKHNLTKITPLPEKKLKKVITPLTPLLNNWGDLKTWVDDQTTKPGRRDWLFDSVTARRPRPPRLVHSHES